MYSKVDTVVEECRDAQCAGGDAKNFGHLERIVVSLCEADEKENVDT